MSVLALTLAASLAFEIGDRVPVTVGYYGFDQRLASTKASTLAQKAWARFCSEEAGACAPPNRYKIDMVLGPGSMPDLDYCLIEIQDAHAFYRCSGGGSIIRDDSDVPDIRAPGRR